MSDNLFHSDTKANTNKKFGIIQIRNLFNSRCIYK